jgi:hypothetical protein
MKYEEVKEMLDRYWEGETTIEEERRIKAYFNAGPIDYRLGQIAPMFQAIREEQKVQLATKAKGVSMRPQMYQWVVAASILLLLSVGWWMFGEGNPIAPVAVENAPATPEVIQAPTVFETSPNAVALVEKPVSPLPVKRKPINKPVKIKPTIDPETAMAMAEIKAALALVSSKLDNGQNQAIKGASYLEAMEKVPKRKAF